MRWAILGTLMLFLFGCASTGAVEGEGCERLFADVSDAGKYEVETRELDNPAWGRRAITVFLPQGVEGKAPVVFFSHGFLAVNWEKVYPDLLRHMATRGNIVVYVPYKSFRSSHEERYNMLWTGFREAVAEYGDRMDLTRVGFVGHSFGGGATPAMAYRGLVEQGWGSESAYLFIMAPWYPHQVTAAQLEQLPAHTRAVVQVYEDDTVNDHRIAINIFRNLPLPRSQRWFLKVRSVDAAGCHVAADHKLPGRSEAGALRAWSVLRVFDALEEGRDGTGGRVKAVLAARLAQGAADTEPLVEEEDPTPSKPSDAYKFPYESEQAL